MLEQVPAGKADWKPHERSMALGYLANLVANIPSWVGVAQAREALNKTTGAHLETTWRLLAGSASAAENFLAKRFVL